MITMVNDRYDNNKQVFAERAINISNGLEHKIFMEYIFREIFLVLYIYIKIFSVWLYILIFLIKFR